MGNFDFTKDHKKILNNLLKFSAKLSIMMASGYISSHYTKIDLINYKKNTFAQISIFLLFEEIINSYVPKWKDDKKSEAKTLNPTKSFPPAKTLNPAKSFPPAKTLNPAKSFPPAKTLNPAHHEL